MGNFPHESLYPADCYPRIQASTADELITLIEELRLLKETPYPTKPAIVIAVWSGSLVKWLTEEDQCLETIKNLKRAIAEVEVRQTSIPVIPSPLG